MATTPAGSTWTAPAPYPTVTVVDARTPNPGELGAVGAGWDVRYAQLGTGRCRCRHASVRTRRVQLSIESFSLGVLKQGRPPRGGVTILVSLGRSWVAILNGRRRAAGEAVVLFDGDDFDFRSAGPAELVSVTFERAALEAQVRARLGRRLDELRLDGTLAGLRIDARALRRFCRSLVGRARHHPRFLEDPAASRRVEGRLVRLLLEECASPAKPEPPSHSRELALQGEAWLRQSLADPPSIADLCSALGASERTLHEAFRRHLGTTPKAYLKALRLNAARQDLLRGTTRVTDVALDWGFLHFGWFSQDYRRLFAESPRETLERGRLHSGGVSSPATHHGFDRVERRPTSFALGA